MSHGGIDMDQFYEDYGDVTVDGIIEAFTSKLIDAIGEEDNMEKMKALVPKRGPKKSDGKIKDPNKPTRGKSAYLFFCAEKREQAKEEILEETEEEKVTVSEVTKKLAAWWDELKGDEDRKEELEGFVAQADEDKERYKEEMEGYTEPTQEELKATVGEKKKRGEAKKKDPDAPKRPKSAYIYFCAEYRESVKADLEEANEEVPSSPEVMSELGCGGRTSRTRPTGRTWRSGRSTRTWRRRTRPGTRVRRRRRNRRWPPRRRRWPPRRRRNRRWSQEARRVCLLLSGGEGGCGGDQPRDVDAPGNTGVGSAVDGYGRRREERVEGYGRGGKGGR